MEGTIYCMTTSYGMVRGNAKKWRYWQPATYRLDVDRMRWVYVDHVGTARRSERLATVDARTIADDRGMLYVPDVRQYRPATTQQIVDAIEVRRAHVWQSFLQSQEDRIPDISFADLDEPINPEDFALDLDPDDGIELVRESADPITLARN